jgi:hypothetical protein
MKNTLICDTETFKRQFIAAFQRVGDGQRLSFELRGPGGLDYQRLEKVIRNNRIITFNGNNFDIPILFYAIKRARENEVMLERKDGGWLDPADIHAAAERIIKGGVRWWEVEDVLGIRIPRDLDHIDLIEPQPNAVASLKTLNGRLHGRWMQDLPFAPDADLTPEQMDLNSEYCWNDLDATELLFEALEEPLKLRAALGLEFDEDFRSKSDSQIGERIVRRRVEKRTGGRIERESVKPGTTFRYTPPDFIRFETQQMREVFDRICQHDFIVNEKGKVDLPKWLKDTRISFGDSIYAMGIGGLHSTESNRALRSNPDRVLIDADVASQYPSIILKLGLFPPAVGELFLDVYGQIKADRMVAKRAGDKVTDKGMKIALNGVYGKLGSPYSILHAPHLMIAVTLTGQLTLLMLIERAEAAGISVVSGNTDGVLFHCPRDLVGSVEGDALTGGLLKEICDDWQQETGFALEFAEYEAIYNQSVNSYFAFKPDGSVKQKGAIANPWGPGGDLRERLMKNPQMTILTDAAIAAIQHGTPIEETIRACRDPRQFVTVVNVQGGGVWGAPPGEPGSEYLGKVVRYYWGKGGRPIFRFKPTAKGTHNKVPKSDGSRPMMVLPDDVPADIDYDRYVAEATKLLKDIGYFAPSLKEPRRTKRKFTPEMVLAWGLAA